MARYDNKRRKLYTNEYQNKDGRYIFHYTDLRGKKCKVYSWALKPEDIPQVIASGKKCPYSLRELEERITADKVKNLESVKSIKMTINDLFEENIELRHLRQSTDGNYRYMYERFIKPVSALVTRMKSRKKILNHFIPRSLRKTSYYRARLKPYTQFYPRFLMKQ